MKRLLMILTLLLSVMSMQAQRISYIESTKSWYYVYDENGKKIKTLSTSIGELKGYSASLFVVRNGGWYYVYNAEGKKTATLSASSVGEVLAVAGETFTSRSGGWIYTWSIKGKKISSRPA